MCGSCKHVTFTSSALPSVPADGPGPSYVFGMASSPAVGMLATVCSDGMLRLWEVGRQHLEEVAMIEVGGRRA
jgi:hypothetical protein